MRCPCDRSLSCAILSFELIRSNELASLSWSYLPGLLHLLDVYSLVVHLFVSRVSWSVDLFAALC